MTEDLKDFMTRLVQEDLHGYRKVWLKKLAKIYGKIPESSGILKIYGISTSLNFPP